MKLVAWLLDLLAGFQVEIKIILGEESREGFNYFIISSLPEEQYLYRFMTVINSFGG